MGRSSKKQLTEVERLTSEIKQLKEVNRSITRQLKKYNKEAHLNEKLPPDEEDQFEPVEKYAGNPNLDANRVVCTKCGVGTVVTTDIGVKWLDMCDNGTCKNRKTRKK